MGKLAHRSGSHREEPEARYPRLGDLSLTWNTRPVTPTLRRGSLARAVNWETDRERLLEEGTHLPEEHREWEETPWASYGWRPQGTTAKRQPRGAGIATFARRLIALERARMRRRASPGAVSRQARASSHLNHSRV
jgi:hypothetical protein